MKNKKKVQIHRFWIPSHHSVKPSLYRLFVARADYDRAIKQIEELQKVELERDELNKRVKMLEDIIAKHTSIPRAVIPKLTTKFPEIVQSEITPVPKE
jgi:hypothetical protein